MQQFHAQRSFITPGAQDAINALCAGNADMAAETVVSILDRHINGDHGDLSEDEVETNNAAILSGDRVVSSYTLSRNGLTVMVWVITDAEDKDELRAATTIFLPGENQS